MAGSLSKRDAERFHALTPAIQEAMIKAVSEGMYIGRAAELAGVRAPLFHRWMAEVTRAEATGTAHPLTAFMQALRQAQAEDEQRRIQQIAAAGNGGQVILRRTTELITGTIVIEERFQPSDWRAHAWHLERAFPKIWGAKAEVHVRMDILRLASMMAEEHELTVEAIMQEAEKLVRQIPVTFDESAFESDEETGSPG